MPLKVVKVKGRSNLYIRGTVAGRRIFTSAQTRDRRIAEQKAANLHSEIERRDVYGEEAFATFAEAALGYVNAGGEKRFLGVILPHFKETRLADMSQMEIDRLGQKAYPHAAPATLRRQWHGPIAAVMNFAAEQGLCHPMRIRRPKSADPRKRWLTPSEVSALSVAASKHLRPIIMFLVGTGARASEAAKLKWDDVDLEGGEAWLWETKSGRHRKVELPSLTVAALSTLENLTGHVHRTPKGAPYIVREGSGGLFNDGLARASERAGLAPVTAHTLRHTWATWFYAQTNDILRLKTLGGWSKYEMVEVYTHLAPRSLAGKVKEAGWNFTPEHRENDAKAL